jgi:hypothetical protein
LCDATRAYRSISCQLATEPSGWPLTSRVTSTLWQDAYSLLKDLELCNQDEGFDAHLQHHVFFVLGDLNYRVQEAPATVLRLVADSAQKEVRLGARRQAIPAPHAH